MLNRSSMIWRFVNLATASKMAAFNQFGDSFVGDKTAVEYSKVPLLGVSKRN